MNALLQTAYGLFKIRPVADRTVAAFFQRWTSSPQH